ncbi:hypothetical protein GALMADRAFT_222866 [Galerina marginata CBS 339.88]|uniref:RGS domain-containing protein n=1 Tax=Galerina marginata (strain CBS 339.88) TaxID=685588 RepID=A0A067TJ77_GALM3|nr:hypothetical protein GALMADRAFT_222866 [Galerina marginata CBS 339.88]
MAANIPQSTGALLQTFHGLNALKMTRFGRPYLGDSWDLFCSLLLSLKIGRRKQAFKTFPDAFTGDEALKSLVSMEFYRSPDTGNRVFSPTIAKISLEEGDGAALMQHFLGGCMIMEARTNDLLIFRKKDIYQLTMKGLRILEGFIEENGIEAQADHLIAVLATLPMPRPKLWRLRRNTDDDDIIVNPSIVTNLFRCVTGRKPNYASGKFLGVRLIPKDKRDSLLKPLHAKGAEPFGWKATLIDTTHCFQAPNLVRYLCDHTTVTSLAEAAEMAAHFVRLGLITLVVDKEKKNDILQILTVNGYAPSGNPFISEEGTFRYSRSAIYAVTDEGARSAGWPGFNAPPLLLPPSASSNSTGSPVHISNIDPNLRSQGLVDQIFKGVNGVRLKNILKATSLRTLLREFLRKESCEYLVSFLLDVDDLKNEFEASSKTIPAMLPVAGSSRMPIERLPSHQSHGPLNNRPFFIYNAYLTPSSEYQLGNWIGRTLRTELQTTLEGILETLENLALVADVDQQETAGLDSSQLEILLEIYHRIYAQVFCILALDFVPRFIKSQEFLDRRMNAWVQDFEDP